MAKDRLLLFGWPRIPLLRNFNRSKLGKSARLSSLTTSLSSLQVVPTQQVPHQLRVLARNNRLATRQSTVKKFLQSRKIPLELTLTAKSRTQYMISSGHTKPPLRRPWLASASQSLRRSIIRLISRNTLLWLLPPAIRLLCMP